MIILSGLISKITHPKLEKAAQNSKTLMKMYRENNIFTSKTMKELLTDTFEYKGKKQNTILLKENSTKKAVEARVKFSYKPDSNDENIFHETIQLVDEKNLLLGEKKYGIKKLPGGKFQMIPGNMYTNNPDLDGVGFRLDQMQIERALQLGIDSIPRFSLAKAVLYHTKMGFLPETKLLLKTPNLKSLIKKTREYFENIRGEIPLSEFTPIVVKKNGEFYIDVNKTKANAELSYIKKLLKQKQYKRIFKLESKPVDMVLEGKELDIWKNIIKEHPILSKLNFNFPKYKFSAKNRHVLNERNNTEIPGKYT